MWLTYSRSISDTKDMLWAESKPKLSGKWLKYNIQTVICWVSNVSGMLCYAMLLQCIWWSFQPFLLLDVRMEGHVLMAISLTTVPVLKITMVNTANVGNSIHVSRTSFDRTVIVIKYHHKIITKGDFHQNQTTKCFDYKIFFTAEKNNFNLNAMVFLYLWLNVT